ncbi:BZ3500_MvSof-1268-A1-R1_Chr6-3g08762 [Microbotryum saponariae]|uniref:BZ3500_MvSof-1268-A1-R1_Chr6-3g08762 protein n=1 Tax=Microbotryum saponariae TaxID=289078 RepID=A0A2X0M5P4_9BASI|nr:BZ3500_MvSof-1268-A1-R1_Chr6-3g08762 [Microbotryum saponariae]SDA07363.1 BZ3501_MvSof-1269-A2-R1_Chr6-2g08465 [Microbotryum saponariae]
MAGPLFGPRHAYTPASTSTLGSSHRASSSSSEQDHDRKQQLFLRLKAVCVPLLNAGRAQPATVASTSQVLHHLTQLSTTLSDIPTPHFTPALANYVFFPLSSLLQPATFTRSDSVLEATMRTLATLIHNWTQVGIDDRIRTELWIMLILRLGGPLDPARPTKPSDSKGKAKQEDSSTPDMSDELKLAIVEALLELFPGSVIEEAPVPEEMEIEQDDDPLGESIDWSAEDPYAANASKASQKKAKPRREQRAPPTSPPIPIMFHTLTTLLNLASISVSLVRLQLAALEALDGLIRFHLTQHPAQPDAAMGQPEGPSPLLATALPGTASTLSRIALSATLSGAMTSSRGRRQSSKAIVSALEVLTNLLVQTIGDDVTARLRKQESSRKGLGATLEEIVESYKEPGIEEGGEEDDTVNSHALIAQDSTPTYSAPGPVKPSSAWLAYTLRSISTLLISLSSLTSHDSPLVRAALAQFLSTLETECAVTLEEYRRTTLELLLILSADDWPSVSSIAVSALGTVTMSSSHLIREGMIEHLGALPRRLRAKDDAAVSRSSKVLRTGLQYLHDLDRLQLLASLERWKWTLLDACALQDLEGSSNAKTASGMRLAWIQSESLTSSGQETEWPRIGLKNAEGPHLVDELNALWKGIGEAAARSEKEAEIIDGFWVVVAGPRRGEPSAATAMWALDGVLQGFKEVKTTKRMKKVLKNLAKAVLALLEQLEEGKEEKGVATNEPAPSADQRTLVEESDTLNVSVQHQHGLKITPELDKFKPVTSAVVARDAKESQQVWLRCFSLRILATCANLLGSSFQPLLLSALYHVLAHLSPAAHPFLRSHSEHALAVISDATAYAAPSNLVLANVDYVVNAVSQRMSVTRLDPSAPLVLVEMIRLVGPPIVPMVQDLVEDVFEALDDYHGYDEVTVGLWAVLDALMRVMSEEAVSAHAEVVSGRQPQGNRAVSEWTEFVDWYRSRNDPPEEELMNNTMPGTNPQRPFAETTPAPPEDQAEPSFPSDETQTPATRPQEVASQIIAKSVYFLSHSSPFLRARVLSLLASSVPLLALRSPFASGAAPPRLASSAREADLLPVIHRAWPYILNRFSDPDPSVTLAATELISSLAQHVGSFMSRRILDDVWPRFKTLLERQHELDTHLASKGGCYSLSFRIYRALLRTMLCIVRDVPLKEEVVWDLTMTLRRFLARREQEELRLMARRVYRALGEVNPDAVWLVLKGMAGAGESWMVLKGVELGDEVKGLLGEL